MGEADVINNYELTEEDLKNSMSSLDLHLLQDTDRGSKDCLDPIEMLLRDKTKQCLVKNRN